MSKKVTVAQMQKFVESMKNDPVRHVVMGEGEDAIVLDTALSLEDTRMFIDRVVHVVVNEDGYFPEMLGVMFFTTALQMMSNVNVPTKNAEVGSETIKVLDLKKLQEWYNTLGTEWVRRVHANPYLNKLESMVVDKINFEKARMTRKTPMDTFFQKVVDTIDHLGNENGVDLARFMELMQIQLSDKKNEEEADVSVDPMEAITVRYGEDGVMTI